MTGVEIIVMVIVVIMFLAVIIIASLRHTEHKGTRCLNCDYSGTKIEFLNGTCPKCGSKDIY
jgi:Zn finger protein HypA/HybF involved in hydrogenase expression